MQTAALNIQSILETTSAGEIKFSLTPSLELVTATVEQDESHDFTMTRHYSRRATKQRAAYDKLRCKRRGIKDVLLLQATLT